MSKGLGQLQRWLIAHLPNRNSGHRATTAELAAAYYATDKPTANQRTTVLRALDNLSQRDLAHRCPAQAHQPGKPTTRSR